MSDEEIEDVVNHLKALGPPDYVSDVTVAPEDSDPLLGAGGGEEGDLYSQAVEIVARDRKASTSYLQRRQADGAAGGGRRGQIGYNRAAKREILIGAVGGGRV